MYNYINTYYAICLFMVNNKYIGHRYWHEKKIVTNFYPNLTQRSNPICRPWFRGLQKKIN